MNIIITGRDGRPSIIQMIESFSFSEEVVLLTKKISKNGKLFYQKMSTIDKKFVTINIDNFFSEDDKIIFWGSRMQLPIQTDIVYNLPNNINNATNKKLARTIFQENNIDSPKLLTVEDLDNCNYPVIIRRSRHRAGIDFFIGKNKEESIKLLSLLGDDYYISEFYPKTKEFRVHCAHGKVLVIKEKPEPENKDDIAWNFHQNNLEWKTIDRKEYKRKMCSLALNAMKTLDLDFGAVDIMSFPTDNNMPQHVVAETNTAPSLTPYLINRYGAYFEYLFNSNEKREHINFENFKVGKSFSWKNYQLKENE